MKFVVKQSFEQGLKAKFGGTFKVRAGSQHEFEQKDGITTVQIDGKARLLSKELTDKLLALGYVEIAE